ncbi:odorant receptor 30a-like [Cardiocondyla obscurior]|uniref:odorant receptor 30a-like n=1 Tax=Cardiocondyla obscurior TaxID=286306 RepID=UPI00396584D8
MINVANRYFSLNQTLLIIIGLWPYKKSKCDVIQIKDLMKELHHIYNNLRDNDEIAIVERYGSNGIYYTTGLTIFITSAIFVFVGIQFWASFKHTVTSNLSYSHQLLIDSEYFVDKEKYFYLIFLHINMIIVIGFTTILATGSMLIVYLQHACGMFKIASYRIKKAIQICNSIPKNVKVKNTILIHNGLVCAVDIHRKAMIFSNYLISSFEMSFMFLIVVGVLALSLNIFRIFQIVLLEFNLYKFFINLVFASSCFVYMFMANFVGQQIIDHNNHVFATAYKAQWYKTSVYIQRLIIILLQRGNKNFGLRVGGLFIASIECFATLFNASMSYFTLMYSVR